VSASEPADHSDDEWWDDDRWEGWDGSWVTSWAPEPEPEPEPEDEPAESRLEAWLHRERDPDSTPVIEELLKLVDLASERLLDRAVRPRVKVSPGGLARAEIDVVSLELPAVLTAGLVIDRVHVRAERVRVSPGLPPHLRAGPVDVTAVVSQEQVDRWTIDGKLPLRLELSDAGVVVTTGIAGIRFGRLLTELDVSRRFLRLRPVRASIIGLPAPLVRFLRGYLPLPPLPRGAHLVEVLHGDGELSARFRIDEFDEPMTPDVARRVAGMLRIPIPGL
jgi:hypothetical protein